MKIVVSLLPVPVHDDRVEIFAENTTRCLTGFKSARAFLIDLLTACLVVPSSSAISMMVIPRNNFLMSRSLCGIC